MNDELNKLEGFIDDLLKQQENLKNKLQESKTEVERLKVENSELRAMLQSQSVRVDALLKKLENSLKSAQKHERGVQSETNRNIRIGESEVQVHDY